MGLQACPNDYIFLPGVTGGMVGDASLNMSVDKASDFNMVIDKHGGEAGQRFCGGRLSYLNGDIFSRPISGECKDPDRGTK